MILIWIALFLDSIQNLINLFFFGETDQQNKNSKD